MQGLLRPLARRILTTEGQSRLMQWNTRTGQKTTNNTPNRVRLRREGDAVWSTMKKKHVFYTCPLCSQPKLPFVYCRKEECRKERP
ncbi:bL32m [Diplonema papillatum]|nr:bL32m [Diplonema papillatum]